MTWTLFSRSIVPSRGLLADPLHVALHRDLAHRTTLPSLIITRRARLVGRWSSLVYVKGGVIPQVSHSLRLSSAFLTTLAGGVGARPLDRLDGHDCPQPAAHVGRGVGVVGVMLGVPVHERLHAGDVLAPVGDVLDAVSRPRPPRGPAPACARRCRSCSPRTWSADPSFRESLSTTGTHWVLVLM